MDDRDFWDMEKDALDQHLGFDGREEDESNIRHGRADTEDKCSNEKHTFAEWCEIKGLPNPSKTDTEDAQAQKSKIDLSDHSDACDCEAMPGEEKWRFVKEAEAPDVTLNVFACRFCGKEVIV